MDFAKAQLSKYGWKEGKGLGANETGVKEALKVKLKFDSAGLGHDRAEEFTFHWWDHVYNKVAGNLEIKKDKEGAVVLEQKEETKISKKKPSVLNKQIVYGNFVKGGTLHGSELVQKNAYSASGEEEEEEERNKDLSLKLSDDELFKICGGRTAHKAARHGLKMTAKLSRVEAQEQLYLEKWGYSKAPSPNTKMEVTKKEQDSDKEKTAVNDICGNIENGSHRVEQEYLQELRKTQTPHASVNIVKKKKKKKERDFCEKEVKCDESDFIAQEHSLQEFGSSEAPSVKKGKRKKNKDFGGIKGEIPNGKDSTLVLQNFQDVDFLKPNHSVKNEKKKRKKELQQKTFDGEVHNFEAGDGKARLYTHKERVVELGAEQKDVHKKSKKNRESMEEDMVTIEENVPRKKRKKKYVYMEEGCEAVVKQDLNVGWDMSSDLIQGKSFKHEERDDSEKFIVNQIDEEISLENKKNKKVKSRDCTEISEDEKFDTDIMNKESKKEQESNTLDEFHRLNENGTVKIEGKKKRNKKTLSDITDKDEESEPVYESEEMFLTRSDGGEEKKKKHKKKESDVTKVVSITESSRNLYVKKKKKDKKKKL